MSPFVARDFYAHQQNLFCKMSNKNIDHNVVPYNVLIDGFYKKGKLDEARKLFYKISKKRIGPNVVMFNAFIASICKKRQW